MAEPEERKPASAPVVEPRPGDEPPGGPAQVPGDTAARPELFRASLRGLCPRCGAPTLFATWVRFAERCDACGLDFQRFNVGDGPAAFLTLIIGTIVVMLAVWLELVVGPPFWVHVLLWFPLVVALVLGGLRIAKAALLHSEFRQNAGEARGFDEPK